MSEADTENSYVKSLQLKILNHTVYVDFAHTHKHAHTVKQRNKTCCLSVEGFKYF